MIVITGASDTPEHEAALTLRKLILTTWPDLELSPNNRLTIVVGAKCHGQKRRDIDLVLLAQFEQGISFSPFLSFTNPVNDELERPHRVVIESFCSVIEVKDLPVEKVRFEGDRVEVRYSSPNHGKWSDVSQQNEEQMYALINYLRAHGIQPPLVTPLIWLRNVPNVQLPKRPHNILGGDSQWELFINVLYQNKRPVYRNGEWRIDANYPDSGAVKEAVTLLTKQVQPTELDRQRMERINERIIDEQRLYEIVGNKLLILRGRGGSGKTIRLLQLAKRLYDEQAARILILTYNRALVADLRRLLTIMGIADGVAERSIQIQTVHSFFYWLLRELGVFLEEEQAFLEHYETFKTEALEMLDVGAVEVSDIQSLKQNNKESFSWDYVFVDEAQDWPEDERSILFHIYPYKVFAVADGIDQLIRNQEPVNWRGTLPSEEVKVIPLKKCLRMKAGLTRFITSLASELGLPSNEWLANEEVPGGRVIVLEGPEWHRNKDLLGQIIAQNKASGNEAVDMLFCVPPSMVINHSQEQSESIIATTLKGWGFEVWDGASSAVRGTYPTEVDQFRIVQYDSCRGLEGWTAVLLGLDEFDTYKRHQLFNSGVSTGSLSTLAARWLLIPLTRAMDTLVINIHGQNSSIYTALCKAAEEHSEFVEWRKS